MSWKELMNMGGYKSLKPGIVIPEYTEELPIKPGKMFNKTTINILRNWFKGKVMQQVSEVLDVYPFETETNVFIRVRFIDKDKKYTYETTLCKYELWTEEYMNERLNSLTYAINKFKER